MPSKKLLDLPEELIFFLKLIFAYGCWKAIHAFLWRTPQSMQAWQAKLTGYEELYASLTSRILNFFGYHSTSAGINIYIDNIHGMWIAEHCLAIPAMVIFSFSVLLFKGKMSDKLWFIPLGIFLIFSINLFRLVSLGMLKAHLDEQTYQMYHRYVFLAITYGLILMMTIWWMDRSMKNLNRDKQVSF